MFRFLKRTQIPATDLLSSKLYDQGTFYPTFITDLGRCRKSVIIESPFITISRTTKLLPTFQKLRRRNVAIIVNTRHPQEHEYPWDMQAQEALDLLRNIGVEVLYTGNHHRKIAVLDDCILWEGSLNILSQSMSSEIMRRTASEVLARQMLSFTKLNRFIK